jgi:hypothetical protein
MDISWARTARASKRVAAKSIATTFAEVFIALPHLSL